MATLNFDASGIDTSSQFDPLPAGEYDAMVTDSSMKKTKDCQGEYLELVLEIQAGEHQGKKLWDRLNLQNRNQKAVEIAQKTLAQICHATGVMQVQDSAQLHNRPFLVKVTVKNDEMRGPQNEIKGYKARQQAAIQPAGGFVAPRVAAQVAAPLPWARAA